MNKKQLEYEEINKKHLRINEKSKIRWKNRALKHEEENQEEEGDKRIWKMCIEKQVNRRNRVEKQQRSRKKISRYVGRGERAINENNEM